MTQQIFLPYKQFRDMYKLITNDNNDYIRLAFRGLGSFYHMRSKTRYVNEDACHLFGVSDIEPYLMLPGEAARLVLMYHYPNGFKQSPIYNDTMIPAPIMFKSKARVDDAIYIDIVSCYAQMYKRLYLDVMFPSLSGKLSLEPISEFYKEYGAIESNKKFAKRSRNAITGLLYSSRILFYNGKKHFTKRIFGNLFNPLLWYSVNWMLHELANVAINCDVEYIATDGYIFSHKSDWQKFTSLLDNLGLDYRCISGKCRIERFGAYSIRDGQALRGDENEKTTDLYKSVLVEKIKLYKDGVLNPVEKMLPKTIARRRINWNKPINNIVNTNGIDIVTKWSKLK